jgi:hypothetical protein
MHLEREKFELPEVTGKAQQALSPLATRPS